MSAAPIIVPEKRRPPGARLSRLGLLGWLFSWRPILLLALILGIVLAMKPPGPGDLAWVRALPTGIWTGITRARPDLVELVYVAEDGVVRRRLVERDRYAAFVASAIERLEAARAAALERAPFRVASRIAPLEAGMRHRIGAFADWYFAWSTGYRLIFEGLAAAGDHVARLGLGAEGGIKAAVEQAVGTLVQRQFGQIVLQPETSGPALEAAMAQLLAEQKAEYVGVLNEIDAALSRLVGTGTPHLEEGAPAPVVTVDWAGHAAGLQPTGNANSGAAFAGRAALALVVGGVARVAAGKATALGVTLLAERLAAPFAAKAVAGAAEVAGGGALGTALGGPVGALAGIAAALATDLLVNEAWALMERPGFEAETAHTLDAILYEMRAAMIRSLQDATRSWYDDAINLTVDLPADPGS